MASQLEGVADLTTKLTELGAKVAGKELRGTVKAAIETALHAARVNIPVGSEPHKTYKGRIVTPGFALASIDTKIGLEKKTGTAYALLGVRPEAFYALAFRELGTATQAADPWLRPAFEESEDAMLRTIASELRDRVEKVAKRRARAGK